MTAQKIPATSVSGQSPRRDTRPFAARNICAADDDGQFSIAAQVLRPADPLFNRDASRSRAPSLGLRLLVSTAGCRCSGTSQSPFKKRERVAHVEQALEDPACGIGRHSGKQSLDVMTEDERPLASLRMELHHRVLGLVDRRFDDLLGIARLRSGCLSAYHT